VIIGTMPNLSEHVENVLGYKKTTYCIPMGIDEPIFALTNLVPADYEEKYLPVDKFIVAHVGSIGISNALETFLACAEAMQDNKDIQFLIVGDGDLREIYKNKYAHLNNLTFAPRVAKDLVQAILVKCDLLYLSVHLSKVWRYGQSLNKLIDYMMSGRPILASYTGYLSMINEANCGSFVAATDVNALRQELERYAKMSKRDLDMIGGRGRLWLLENRNYSQLARKYIEIISDNPN
jgi:glycosyltransferase involved in cell wall biosynthesis